jgi:hypothetical protein
MVKTVPNELRRSRRLAKLEPEVYVREVPEVDPTVPTVPTEEVKSWWSYIFPWR